MTAKQKPFNKSNSFAGMTAKKNLLTITNTYVL